MISPFWSQLQDSRLNDLESCLITVENFGLTGKFLGRGSIGGGPVEEVVFDPSAAWAHSEFEFGIMGMFGGFGGSFSKEYWKYKPKDEPAEEWEDRVQLYELLVL